jgi:hypothetical protein
MICTAPSCGLSAVAKTFCDRHYRRWKKHGDPLKIQPTANRRSHFVIGDTAFLQVASGEYVLVSAGDFHRVACHNWQLTDGYAHRSGVIDGRRQRITLHSVILGKAPEHMVIDHINRVRGDNRRQNLRYATFSENAINRSVRLDNSCGHTGIYFSPPHNKWKAYLYIGGRMVYLGLHEDMADAIAVRKAAEVIYHRDTPAGYFKAVSARTSLLTTL